MQLFASELANPYFCLFTTCVFICNQSEVEETLKRLQNHKGVQGIVIVNSSGIPIRSTLTDPALTTQYAALISQLASKARSTVKELDPSNDLSFLRVRTKKHEIMIAPGIIGKYYLNISYSIRQGILILRFECLDQEYLLIVIQTPTDV